MACSAGPAGPSSLLCLLCLLLAALRCGIAQPLRSLGRPVGVEAADPFTAPALYTSHFMNESRAFAKEGKVFAAKYAAQQASLWMALMMRDATRNRYKYFINDLYAIGDAQAAFKEAAFGSIDGTSWPQPSRHHDDSYKADIGIVSLCAYDSLSTPMATLSITNTRLYADYHGYAVYLFTTADSNGRPPAWGKIRALQEALPAHEWLMWLDCDSFVMNFTRRLEALLPNAGRPHLDSESGAEWGWGSSIDLLIAEDGAMFNTGVFFLRRTRWSAALLRRIEGPRSCPWASHPFWEQAALQGLWATGINAAVEALTAAFPAAAASSAAWTQWHSARSAHQRCGIDAAAASDIACRIAPWNVLSYAGVSELLDSVAALRGNDVQWLPSGFGMNGTALRPEALLLWKARLLPQRWFNAYPQALATTLRDSNNRNTHALFRDGDFIISFSGCKVSFSQEQCNNAFQEAYRVGLASWLSLPNR